MKFTLSVIALCLVMITAKLYIPEVQAEVVKWFVKKVNVTLLISILSPSAI